MSASLLYVAVIDDDEQACRAFARLLRASDMQAITYSSAEAFLADTKRPRFDCLVVDIQLGGMSGIQFAERLKADGALTPFLFITAHDTPEARAGAAAAGCAAYFRKSDAGGDVLATIRRVTA